VGRGRRHAPRKGLDGVRREAVPAWRGYSERGAGRLGGGRGSELGGRRRTRPSFADGREPNWRNLMIQYAVTARFVTIGEFAAAMDNWPCPPA
jgi:hypothetical protein